MSQGIENRGSTPKQLQSLYAIIRDHLVEVEDILREELSSDHPFVDEMVKHGFRLGGKRLRPALVLLSGLACGELKADHAKLAATVEMIHTATLIHDDVLDEATIRRHLDTVNARWDNEASVLVGDYLFTRAICMASAVESTFACQVVGEASRVMCEGELRQIGSRGRYDLSEEEYLDIISDKTAALCSCCCRLGAHYADATPEQCDALSRIGLNLGIAFQIADDVLDLLGDEDTTGKSLGTDLVKEKPTLPLIRLLDQATPDERAEIIEALTDESLRDRDLLRARFDASDALEYSKEKAKSFIRLAKQDIDQYLPESDAAIALRKICDFVIERHQ